MRIKRVQKKVMLILLLLVFILPIIFTGCGIFSRSEAAVSESGYFQESEPVMVEEVPVAPEEEVAKEYALAEEEKAITNGDIQYSDTPQVSEQKVIKTAYMDLEVSRGKFEKALFDITRLAENNGGFVSHTQSYSDKDGNLTGGSIVIRIPQNSYNSVIEQIKNMGTVKSISISGQDVTQEYVDLESRLKNLTAQEKILLDLMAQSKEVIDSVEVQRELSIVQEQIEVMKGRMNYLDNMVSFSTIEINLFEPEPITATTGWGLLDAIKRGLRGAVTVFNIIVTLIVAVSPIVAILAIIAVIVWLIIRARQRRKGKKNKLT